MSLARQKRARASKPGTNISSSLVAKATSKVGRTSSKSHKPKYLCSIVAINWLTRPIVPYAIFITPENETSQSKTLRITGHFENLAITTKCEYFPDWSAAVQELESEHILHKSAFAVFKGSLEDLVNAANKAAAYTDVRDPNVVLPNAGTSWVLEAYSKISPYLKPVEGTKPSDPLVRHILGTQKSLVTPIFEKRQDKGKAKAQ